MSRPLATAATWGLLAVVWIVLLAGGCADTGPSPPPGAWSHPPASSTPEPAAPPVRVEIPTIDASSTLVPLHLDTNKALEVPKTADQAGWYADGVTPGDPGPAIIVGHINYRGEPGVFGRLGELKVGDEVHVVSADATVLRFVVVRTQQVAKGAFPWREVAADTQAPSLRVITCTGAFDRAARSYVDNLIVWAELAP